MDALPTTRSPADNAPPPPPPDALDARLAEAHAMVAAGTIDVLSLDVFDTMLWRKVPEPVEAFLLLGRRLRDEGLLAPDVPPPLFSRLRQTAEWHARDARTTAGGGTEVTLAQIYERFPRFALSAGLDAVMAAEVDVEREILVPDLDVLELIRAARERGLRIVAVSDTYFDEAHLRSFLGRPPAPAFLPDRIFASSAHGVGKGSGLFGIVLRELRVTGDRVLHVGDNPDADVAPARRLGIRPVLFERRPKPLEALMRREAMVLRSADATASGALTTTVPGDGDHGLAALRSKMFHRAERSAQPPALAPFWDFGATVLGPVLTGYAEWVVQRAQGMGVRRVQCLMREGALLAELVDRAAVSLGADVRAETLWLSRQVCARASIRDAASAELEELFVRRKLPTLRELTGTLGLDLARDLPDFAHRADARLADGELSRLVLERIEEDAALRARIVAQAQATRRRVLRIAESRADEHGRVLLADLGWGGTIQHLLDRVLASEGSDVRTVGFYLLTEQRAVDRMMAGTAAHGFLAAGGHPDPPTQALMRSPEVVEQVCMPSHGSQIDLTDDLEPVLAPDHTPAMQAVERSAVQAGAFAFQRQWVRYGAGVPWGLRPLAEARDLLLAIFARSVISPTKDEALAFGGWQHDEGFGSSDVDRIVQDDMAAAIPYVDPLGLTWDLPFQEVYWPYALAALHDDELATATAALHGGRVPGEAFGAPLETGAVELFLDTGWGFSATGMVRVRPRTNRHGRTYARGELRADFVKRIRFDPAQSPCIVRIDWIALRCWAHDQPGHTDHRIAGSEALSKLEVHGARVLRPGLLFVRGRDPQVIVDVAELTGQKLWRVDLAVGFAVLPLQPGQTRARYETAKREAAQFARNTPAVGRPAGLVRKVLRRLRG